jgi:hypothetical protein
MRFRLRRLLAASVLMLATAAAADDGKAQAKALFESGTAHYNLSEFKEALGDFREAYRMTRDPTFLFNIAQCQRQLGDPAAAASSYRAYRRESPDAPNRAEVDRLIGEMDKAAAARQAPPTETIPPQPQTQSAPLESHPTTPGEVSLTPAEPSASVATVHRRPVTRKPWFWVTVGAGALVIAGVTVGVVLGTAPRPPSPTVGHANGN